MFSYPVTFKGKHGILRPGSRPGTFLVWAQFAADAPKVWCGNVLTSRALSHPMDASEAARRFPELSETIASLGDSSD